MTDKQHRPMEWAEFKALSKEEQIMYVQRIIEEYGVGFTALSAMFGVNINTCSQYIRRRLDMLPIPKRTSKAQNQQFLADFCTQTVLQKEEKQPITKTRKIRGVKTTPPKAAQPEPIPEDQHEPELPKEAQQKPVKQQEQYIQQEPETLILHPASMPAPINLKRSVLYFAGPLNAQDIAAKLNVLFAEGKNVRVQIEIEAEE